MTRSVQASGSDGRLFDALLAIYPRPFRRRFAAGMRHAFEHDRRAAASRGPLSRLAFWPVAVAQLLVNGVAERARHHAAIGRSHLMRWVSLASPRDAIRALRATPALTGVAVLSLALGIGANTALFSILNSLLLKTLPVLEPERLVTLQRGAWTYPIWEQMRAHGDLFDGVFAWANQRFDLADGGERVTVDGAYVSGGAFDVLGLRPVLGRPLTADDDRRGGGPDGPVAVISHRFWQRQFGGAPDVLGRSLGIQRVPFTIVGVMGPEFFGPDVGRVADVMVPFGTEALIQGDASALDRRSSWWVTIWARLRPGQTLEEANAALRSVQPRIRDATVPTHWMPEDQRDFLREPLTLTSAATGRSLLRTRYQRPLTVLLAVVAIVLVIACTNIANLMIARSATRRHELSVRLALGASRARLAGQMLLESAMLGVVGALGGLLFAAWASRTMVAGLQTQVSSPSLDLALDLRVLSFTAALALVTTLLFGLAPALMTARVSPNDALKERGRGADGGHRLRGRQALVAVQVALSLALVVGAGLFARTFWSLATSRLGFDVDPVLLVDLDAAKTQVPPEGRPALLQRLREAAETVPGVAAASLSFTSPVGGSFWNTLLIPAGATEPAEGQFNPWVNPITPEFFDVYGMRLVSGRGIAATDRGGTTRVAVVNEAFVRSFLSEGDPVGQTFRTRDVATVVEYAVVGVVEDAVYQSLRAGAEPTIYLASAQVGDAIAWELLSVRAASGDGSSAALARAVADAVRRIDPAVSFTARPLSRQIGQSLNQERLIAMMSVFFGALALLLAALGLYGITAHAVARRRAELGIRLALGARPSGIVALVLSRVARTVGFGVLAGAALSWWAARYIETLLYDVQARDPLTFTAAAAVLTLTALLAAWIPARRAAATDPTVVLRVS